MKQLTLISLLIASGLTAASAPLTPAEALGRLEGSTASRARQAAQPELVRTINAENGVASIYVFNNPSDNGYLVVSADDLALPLLGYADAGAFDAQSVSPAFEWWLQEYARQIEYARNNTAPSTHVQELLLKRDRVSRTPIAPMIQTDWDQVEPFNNQCPKYGADRTYTGCVATAMSQVMNYWKYPERGQGTITYNAESVQKKLSLDFSKQPFDWDNMIDMYLPGEYTEVQANAVAYLMKAAGYAVRSDYGLDSTGALAMYIRQGLVKYFNYDGNARYDLRIMYSASEWEQMIYDNLKNVGPVLYGGGSMIGGGHSFVCDGYDKDGYFHFNWGWTGISNGYFLLNALNPDALGSGGGNGGGYNFTQDAVFGIQPPTGGEVVEQPDQLIEIGSLVAEIEDGALLFDLDMTAGMMWVNYTPTTQRVNLGACFTSADNPADKHYYLVSDKIFPVPSGYGIDPSIVEPKVILADTDLTDGTYHVSIVTRAADGPEDDWQSVRNPHGYYDYVILTRKNGEYSVRDIPAPSLDVVDGGFLTDIYYGCQNKVYAKVKNNSDIELSTGLAPVLFDATGARYLGESVLVSVMPGETVYTEWITGLYDMASSWFDPTSEENFAMTFMDEESMLTYAGDLAKMVTVYPNPGTPSLTLTDTPKVENGTVYRPTSFVDQSNVYYLVSDPGNMIITGSVMVSSGVFAYPMQALLCVMSDEYEGMVEILATGSETLFLDEGETGEFRITLSYPPLEPKKDYLMIPAYLGTSGQAAIPGASKTVHIRLDDGSGIGEAAAAESETMQTEVTDLTGRRVALVNGRPDLTDYPAGIYILRELKADGSEKIRKILK